jgi:hypothetical protein
MRYNKKIEGRQYFVFEERYNTKTRIKWIFLKDLSGVIWGLFSSYKTPSRI